MNYNELQQIVRHIRKNLECPICQHHYDNSGIEVLSTFDDQGLFHLSCSHCQNQVMAHVTISPEESILTKTSETHQQKISAERSVSDRHHRKINSTVEQVSANDVIDIHSFLSEFNGDFKSLFSNK